MCSTNTELIFQSGLWTAFSLPFTTLRHCWLASCHLFVTLIALKQFFICAYWCSSTLHTKLIFQDSYSHVIHIFSKIFHIFIHNFNNFCCLLFSFASNFNTHTDLLTCTGSSSFYTSYIALTFSLWPYIWPQCAVVHWATCTPVWNLCANMYNCNIAWAHLHC